MRVGVNARLLRAPSLRGWNRYTVNLLAHLPAFGAELYLYTDRPIHPTHLGRLVAGSFVIRIAPPMRYPFWEQVWLPRSCAADHIDVLHTPFNFGLPWYSPCPRVLTLHDAIDQLYYRPRQRLRQQLRAAALLTRLYHWSARRCADRIITVSENARRDLVDRLGIDPAKVCVIYEAADERFHEPVDSRRCSDVRQRHGLSRPYFFYVGGLEVRKNLPLLIEGFAAAGLDGVELVLGGGDTAGSDAIRRVAVRAGVGHAVRLLGEIDDADLPALYAEALAFVYPSEYEGFGLQLCEAMAVGCPVLAACATSLPEVLGDGGQLFHLENPAQLAAQLRKVALDAGLRQLLSRRARQRALAFSWHRTAADTHAVYRALIRDRADTPSPEAFSARPS